MNLKTKAERAALLSKSPGDAQIIDETKIDGELVEAIKLRDGEDFPYFRTQTGEICHALSAFTKLGLPATDMHYEQWDEGEKLAMINYVLRFAASQRPDECADAWRAFDFDLSPALSTLATSESFSALGEGLYQLLFKDFRREMRHDVVNSARLKAATDLDLARNAFTGLQARNLCLSLECADLKKRLAVQSATLDSSNGQIMRLKTLNDNWSKKLVELRDTQANALRRLQDNANARVAELEREQDNANKRVAELEREQAELIADVATRVNEKREEYEAWSANLEQRARDVDAKVDNPTISNSPRTRRSDLHRAGVISLESLPYAIDRATRAWIADALELLKET